MKKQLTIIITGSIAVVKVADICQRLLQTGEYDLKCVVSEHAQQLFDLSELTTIIGENQLYTDFFDESTGVTHIDLAQQTDAIIVLPASYNIIGKMANGIADDLASTVLAAASQNVLFIPAMNTVMYENPIFQENQRKLEQLGHQFMPPVSGMLKCGVEGIGRLPEPVAIVTEIARFLAQRPLSRKRVLITAGPTRVYLDPIRYISNTSSGTMGYELAREAQRLGAQVTLVLGPSALGDLPGVEMIRVETPQEMYEACEKEFAYSDVVIMNAAVSDYKPKTVATKKIKKAGETLILELERSIDILATLGQQKVHQLLVGFAAESENHLENARGKLVRKNADVIIANDVAHFRAELHQATIVTRTKTVPLPAVPKAELAVQIWQQLVPLV